MSLLSTLFVLVSLATGGGPEAPKPGPRVAEPLPSVEVPAQSTLYHTLSGREAQVVFTTDAPLENIVGKSNEVVGYVISGPKEHPERLTAGKWLLPVASLATGIPLRDEHLAGSKWLDAKTYPNLSFELEAVEDLKEIKRGDGFVTWEGTLSGKMTVHGVERSMKVPGARLSCFVESEKTRAIARGELLFIRCEYDLKLSDFGVTNPDVPEKVSDTVRISETLRLTSSDEAAKATPNQPASEQQTSTAK